MLKVVLTGAGFDENGQNITRQDLIIAAMAAGYQVQGKIDHYTNMLVASRNDTVKAKLALKMVIPVVTYVEFAKLCLNKGVKISEYKSGAAPNPYTDVVQSPMTEDGVPDFVAGFDYGDQL